MLKKADLFQYTLLVFGTGAISGVLLHFLDFGVPTSYHKYGVFVLVICCLILLLFCVLGFFSLIKTK
jgi:hypothetical protein